MTPAQVVRRRFKSSLPRKIEDRELTPVQAMAETMGLLERFRGMLADEGMDPHSISVGLVYDQPSLKEKQGPLADTVALLGPEDIGQFVRKVSKLDRPRFLGLVFNQLDEKAEKAEYRNVLFAVPFVTGPDAAARLVFARERQRGLPSN